MVVKVVTTASEDPIANQVPFGQLSRLTVVAVELAAVAVVVVCFV